MIRKVRLILCCPLLLSASCVSPDASSGRGAEGPPRFFTGMGAHHRTITTRSPEAQRYFDQGLIWAFAFNHDEAIRSFTEAARLDPNCAMAYWGIALCNGPHINNPIMTPERSIAAWAALEKARSLKSGAGPVEQALIEALSRRYASPAPADRKLLDQAYAEAMRQVFKAYSSDADVATLFAEAMMDLRPWDLWMRDGQPHPGTTEIVETLQIALKLDADHPGANHLLVHAVESSPRPQDGLAAADRLCRLVPASGHLVHMPAHIYARTGRWEGAADQNIRAIEADRKYREISPRQGFYRIYMAHNHHFLAYACMMEGRSELGLKAARELVASIPPESLREQAEFIDPVMTLPFDVLMRFGRWEEVLREPPPPKGLPISEALYHYVRGIAYAARGQPESAQSEEDRFRLLGGRIPKTTRFGNNSARDVLAIANHMLAGEIAYRRGDIVTAVEQLRAAAKQEDTLIYNDPPDWIQPARHTLGAVLMAAKRYDEAEKAYREDLAHWPENGWSLFGLSRSLRAQGKTSEADAVEQQFKKAWARADVKIGSSCLCVREGEASVMKATVGRPVP